MSIFKNLFQSNINKKEPFNWLPLTEISQLDKIIEESLKKPILIFKHSTRCGTSRYALKYFEKNCTIESADLDLYYLDLIEFRDLSNAIAEKFSVIHQSPQAILIKNGIAVYHDSHSNISLEEIKKAI